MSEEENDTLLITSGEGKMIIPQERTNSEITTEDCVAVDKTGEVHALSVKDENDQVSMKQAANMKMNSVALEAAKSDFHSLDLAPEEIALAHKDQEKEENPPGGTTNDGSCMVQQEEESTDAKGYDKSYGFKGQEESQLLLDDEAKNRMKAAFESIKLEFKSTESVLKETEKATNNSFSIPTLGQMRPSVTFSEDVLPTNREQVDGEEDAPLISDNLIQPFNIATKKELASSSLRDILKQEQQDKAIRDNIFTNASSRIASVLGVCTRGVAHLLVANVHFITFGLIIPCLCLVWYAAAILFPPTARGSSEIAGDFLWTDGELRTNEKGQPSICPRPSICSEGVFQICLITLARITAFASYVFMAYIFISKLHFLSRMLSGSYLREYVPFQSMHEGHTSIAKIYGVLIAVHVLSHYVRYIVRADRDQLSTNVHVFGVLASVSMFGLIFGMSTRAKKLKFCTFEKRLNLHWTSLGLFCFSLCYHHIRTRIVTLVLL